MSDPRANWVLVISQRGQTTHTVPFSLGLVFGRSSRCSCVLDDPTVSGKHAQIVEKDGQVVVEDLGSENKTHVSDGPTLSAGETYVLQPGTAFQVGRTFIELRTEELAPKTAAIEVPSTATRPIGALDEMPTAGDGSPEEWNRATQPGGMELDPDATMLRPDEPPVAPAASPPKSAPAAPAPRDEPSPAAPVPPTPATPAPAPAPAPAAPGGPSTDSMGYEGTIDFGAAGGSGVHAKLAAEGSLAAARARLVIASPTERRIALIESPVFSIGRGKEATCQLAHPAVSTPHATIRFKAEENRFFVQDDGSRNHTYVDGKLIPPGTPHELRSSSHLRFGPVDALFVVEIDPDGVRVPTKRQELAAQILVDTGTISAAQRASAVKQAQGGERQVGEALVLSPEAVTVKQWVDALEQARYLELTGLSGKRNRMWILVIALLALAAIVFVVSRL